MPKRYHLERVRAQPASALTASSCEVVMKFEPNSGWSVTSPQRSRLNDLEKSGSQRSMTGASVRSASEVVDDPSRIKHSRKVAGCALWSAPEGAFSQVRSKVLAEYRRPQTKMPGRRAANRDNRKRESGRTSVKTEYPESHMRPSRKIGS